MVKRRPKIEEVDEPFCGQWRVDMVSVLDAAPEVAEQWCYEKNCGFGPDDFSHGSSVRPWWYCEFCQNTWRASIGSRIISQTGCPYCANKKVSTDNNLAALVPELTIEWHPSKNKKLKPTDVVPGSVQKVWWRCSRCAHDWKTPVHVRAVYKHGCPNCYQIRLEEARNRPCAKRANRPSIPRQERSQLILSRKGKISRAWYESNDDFDSLLKSHPEVARQWHPTKNGNWKAKDFSYGSDVVAWWYCLNGKDHEWQSTITHRTAGKGCPFCAGKRVSKTNSLKANFPKLAKEWHPTLNGDLTPNAVTIGSGRSVYWLCKENSNHVWQAVIQSRVGGSNCPFCANRAVSTDNNLKALFPHLAAQWHQSKNGDLKPNAVTPGSKKRVWWQCRKGDDHEWQATVRDRARQGNNCPFCSGNRASANNSLASTLPEIAREWHKSKNGKLTAAEVKPGSHKVVWWYCQVNKNHVYERAVRERALLLLGCKLCTAR